MAEGRKAPQHVRDVAGGHAGQAAALQQSASGPAWARQHQVGEGRGGSNTD